METSFEELIEALKKYVNEENWYSVQALAELISEQAKSKIEDEISLDKGVKR